MGKMSNGYGSEYQLLRFLGHRRNELENIIRTNSNLKGSLEWLDFPSNQNSSFDDEHKGIDFLKEHPAYSQLKGAWSKFWAQSGNPQNWDAVLIHNGDEYVVVEAKAHIGELCSGCKASSPISKQQIKAAMRTTQQYWKIQAKNDWLAKYYQLANRLAFVAFLQRNGIKCSLLNIYFINGYKLTLRDRSVSDQVKWDKKIQIQYDYLGIIGTEAEPCINKVFVDCRK